MLPVCVCVFFSTTISGRRRWKINIELLNMRKRTMQYYNYIAVFAKCSVRNDHGGYQSFWEPLEMPLGSARVGSSK